jgi:hypothetical protein
MSSRTQTTTSATAAVKEQPSKRKNDETETAQTLRAIDEWRDESSSRIQKKRKLLRKLKKGTPEERRAAIESGKVKFVNQELTESNLKKIIASNCVIIGDNNTVIGDDNVLIGKDNKASGENNKFIKSPLPATAVLAEPEQQQSSSTVSSSMASAISRQVRVAEHQQQQTSAAAAANTYFNTQLLTLPDHWIVFNGVMIYKEDDILTLYKWMHDHGTCIVGYKAPRALTFDRALLHATTPAISDIVGRYNIPFVTNMDAQARLIAQATAFGVIPMPAGMPPSTRAPHPHLEQAMFTLTRSDMEPHDQFSSASITNNTTTNASTSNNRATTSSATIATTSKKKPSFLPKPGVNPDESAWKVSPLDLPGSASIAGKDEPTCKICLTNRIDVIFEPCHHFAYCRDCVKEMYASNPEQQLCPSCRGKIEYATVVFIQ